MRTWFSTKSRFEYLLLVAVVVTTAHCSREASGKKYFLVGSEADKEATETTFAAFRDSISFDRISIDMNKVYGLETLGCDAEAPLIANRFVFMVYVADIPCETCFDESVANIRLMKQEFSGALDFYFVANLAGDRRERWLRAMMRTSVLSCPVFLDPDGFSALPSRLCFYLVDMRDSTVVRRYFPQRGGPQAWADFRAQVRDIVIDRAGLIGGDPVRRTRERVGDPQDVNFL